MTTTHIMSDETGQQILAQLTAISQALDDGALTNQQISTVLSDGTPTGTGFLDGGGLKTFFDGLKTKFAAITHNHSDDALSPASVTATGKVKAATIEDSVGSLASLRESVSRKGTVTIGMLFSSVAINGQYHGVAPLRPGVSSVVLNDVYQAGMTSEYFPDESNFTARIIWDTLDVYTPLSSVAGQFLAVNVTLS